MPRTCGSAVLATLLCSLLPAVTHSYDFGQCLELSDPVGIHPSTGAVVQAGRFEVTKTGEQITVVTICDESNGWILADTRFQTVKCSYDERKQVWLWSHQHRSQLNPPQIRCSSFSPRPLEQSYTLRDYQGCNSADIQASLTTQVSFQLETALPCRVQHQCEVPSVRCWGENGGSKLSVLVEATMLDTLDEQRRMLADAAKFLRETFRPVFSSGSINKRDSPWDGDPDDSTTANCTAGEKTVIVNATSSYCVACSLGTYVDKTDTKNEKCEPCPYDSYRENKSVAQCTDCAAGKGTLVEGSDSKDNCTDICVVPKVNYTTSTEPSFGERVLEGGDVTLHCDSGFYYGNEATSDVRCESNNNTNNNFPSSCRKITVKTPRTSIVDGSNVTLTCEVTATGSTPNFTWYLIPTGKDLAEQLSKEGVKSWSSPLFNITNFGGNDGGDYFCKPDYDDPILDDRSKPVTVSALDVRLDPKDRAIVYAGDKLNLTCTMRIDPNYPKRSIEWRTRRNSTMNDTIVSGLSTWQTDQDIHSVLTLHPLDLNDTDYYFCLVNYTNTVGNETVELDGRFNVIVRGFVKEPNDTSVLLGKKFELQCQLHVGPGMNWSSAALRWEKYDEQTNRWSDIKNDTRSKISQTFNVTSFIFSSNLTVENTNRSDSGRYKCRSKFTRKDGDYLESIATVTTYDLGVVTHPEDRAYLVGERAEMSCKVAVPGNQSDHVSVRWVRLTNDSREEFVPNPDQTVFFNSTSGISRLIINNVSMNNASNYKCNANYQVNGKSSEKNSSLAKLYVRELSSDLEEYSLIHIPFYYDDNDNMYNGTDDKIDDERWANTHEFSCKYHGDDNVGDVFWTVKSGNNTLDFLSESGNSFEKGSYKSDDKTWLTKLRLSRKFITTNYNASLTCQFNFSTVGEPINSTTNFIVHAIRPLESKTATSNSTVNITCSYVGTDEPDSITWLVDDKPLSQDNSDPYTIQPEYFDRRLRFDVLTVSDRTYSDPERNISCRYSFSKPKDVLLTYTDLIYRGMHKKLQPVYYLAKGHGPVSMQCQLGVGADGSAPDKTNWYLNDTLIESSAYWVKITTDTSPTNGLFKSALTVSDKSINSSYAGNYSCSFQFEDNMVDSKDSNNTVYRNISSYTYMHTRMPYRRPNQMFDVIYGYSPNVYRLYCSIESDESPDNVTWSGPADSFIENATLGEVIKNFSSNGTSVKYHYLNLTLPSSDDSGSYSCKFNFKSGPSVQETFPKVQFNEIKVTNQPRVYATASNVTVKLECKVESHKSLELGWYDVDFEDWIAPSNLSYKNGTTVATYNLKVNSVDDNGTFTCVLDENQYSKKNVSVEVLDLHPSFSEVVVGNENDQISISCGLDYYDDLEKPTIEWFKDGVKYDQNIQSQLNSEKNMFESELKFTLDSDVANKKFHCVGRYSNVDAASDLVSENVTIFMTGIVAEREYVIAAVGDNVPISCTAYSKQPETIYWRMKVNGNYMNITDFAERVNTSSEYVSKSVYNYTDVQSSYSNKDIECYFKPKDVAERSAKIILDVIDVQTKGREVMRGKSANLTCSANPSFTRSEDLAFKWLYKYKNTSGWEMEFEVPDNETYSKDGKSELKVQMNNDTEYTCVVTTTAHTNSGNASRGASFYVFDLTNPKDVIVEAGKNVSLTCGVFENTGTPSFSWYKHGSDTLLYESAGNSTNSTYNFTAKSYEDSGSYYCNVTVLFDGEDNGPFKSGNSSLIVRDILPSFKGRTLVHNDGNVMGLQELECKLYGDLGNVSLVEWETPAGRYSDGDYAEMIQVEDTRGNDSYVSVLTYDERVYNGDEFFCDFNWRSGDMMKSGTNASLFSYSELYNYTYNPTQINFTYTGEVESNVTWHINGQSYDESTHTQFTPSSDKVNETFTRFQLKVDMSKFAEGVQPVDVKGKIGFKSENVTLPYPDKEVKTRIFKRVFIEELQNEVKTSHEETQKSFTCLVSGENDNFTFSWFIGDSELQNEEGNITITNTSVNSKNQRKSILTIKNLNASAFYNDELRCVATWEVPETFSTQSASDLNTVGASMEPRFFTQVDGSAVLTCLVWGNEQPKQVVWTDEDGDVVEPAENRIVIGNKTVQTKKNDVHVHTLKFVSFTPANEGRYTCSVTFQDDKQKTMETDVNFIGASFEPESPYFVHDLSKTIQFTCKYRGFREPKNVTWFKDSEDELNKLTNHSSEYDITTKPFDSALNSQESIITMKSNDVNKMIKTSGTYICKWETDQLNVSAPLLLAVRTLKQKADIFYSTHGIISLECEYRGQKEGAVEWFYKSELITDEDDRTSFERTKFEHDKQTFKLRISEARIREDAGRYSCVLSFDDGDKISATTDVVIRRSEILSDYLSSYLSNSVTEPLVYAADDRLEMQCLMEGDKIPADVQWFYKDRSVTSKIIFDGFDNTMVNALHNKMTWGVSYFSNITLKVGDHLDGNYSCKFSFFDKDEASGSEKSSSTVSHVTVLKIDVTPDETCTFVDYQKNDTMASLGCSFEGDIGSVDVSLKTALMYLPNGKVRSLEVSKNTDYEIANVSNAEDGIYRCAFVTNSEGKPEFSATQRLTARKATLSSPRRRLVLGTTLTLTCTVPGGAKSISWYENGTMMSGYEILEEMYSDSGLIKQQSVSLQVRNSDDDSNANKSYTCRGMIYDDFCPKQQEFDSAAFNVEVIPAEPIRSPSDGFAYYGESHEFRCQFPDAGDGELYNVYWMFDDKRIMRNGDHYENGKRVIHGTIETFNNRSHDGLNIIESRYRILSVNSMAEGEYKCGISWLGGQYIKSQPGYLAVREILQPPSVTNVVLGANATLSCSATGDKAANITFHKVDWAGGNSTIISGATQKNNSAENPKPVITEGEVTLTADNSSSGYYFCNVTWGNRSLTSDPVYLNVFKTYGDGNDTWGVLGSVVRVECMSDGELRKDENRTSYRDEKDDVVFPDAEVTWFYKGKDDQNFTLIDSTVKHFMESSWIGFDGFRRSGMIIGPIVSEYDLYEFHCAVNYDDKEAKRHNFFGGIVFSKPTKLQISRIKSFETSPKEVIDGESFDLTCTALGKETPNFRITNDGRTLDTSRYTIKNSSIEHKNNVEHISKYEIQTWVATVLQGGQDFYCSVDFGPGTTELREKVKITTYYNCKKAKISVLGKQPTGQKINYEDDNGKRTAKVQCPDNTTNTRYIVYESDDVKKESVCQKDTGFYSPPYLAPCLESRAFTSGRFEQVWTLDSKYGAYCTDSSPEKFTKKKMTEILTTDNSVCGPYPHVPCLKDNKCSLDDSKTGCRWDGTNNKLYVFYQVTFNDPVWTIQERNKLTNPAPRTKIRFWDCPASLLNPKKRTLSKRGKLFDRMVVDQDSDRVVVQGQERSYSALGIGIAGFVAAAILVGAFLYKRRYSRGSPDMVVGTQSFEMTERSLVLTNPSRQSS